MTAIFVSPRVQFIAWLAALAFLAVITVGCGPSDKLFPVHAVSGKVSFQGKAPEGAQVFLKPVNAPTDANYTPIGVVGSDGAFQVSTYGKNDGAPAGEYVAFVQWFRVVTNDGATGRGPNVIPKEFASPTTSPVKVTVKEGSNVIPDIVIK